MAGIISFHGITTILYNETSTPSTQCSHGETREIHNKLQSIQTVTQYFQNASVELSGELFLIPAIEPMQKIGVTLWKQLCNSLTLFAISAGMFHWNWELFFWGKAVRALS
jgi:hypothetical protein